MSQKFRMALYNMNKDMHLTCIQPYYIILELYQVEFWAGHQVNWLLLFAIKKGFIFIGMWQYVEKLRIAPFAQSFVIFWRNMTALPPGIEEAAFIFHVSRGNWSAAFSAPILQYFATIDNLSVDHNYVIKLRPVVKLYGF